MTKNELRNGLYDTLGIEPDLTGYPTLTKNEGYEESNRMAVTDSYLNTMNSLARRLAQQFYQSLISNDNPSWDCENQDSCAKLIQEDVIKLLWRRPLMTSEQRMLEEIADLYDDDESQSIEVLQFALSSPQFYIKNLTESTSANGQRTPIWEHAQNMSFILGHSFIPRDLFEAMENQSISTHEEINRYAANYLEEEQIMSRVADHFFGVWLGYKEQLESSEEFGGVQVSQLANKQKENVLLALENDAPLDSLIGDESRNGYLGSRFSPIVPLIQRKIRRPFFAV